MSLINGLLKGKKVHPDRSDNSVLGFEEKKEIMFGIEAIEAAGNVAFDLTKHKLKSL